MSKFLCIWVFLPKRYPSGVPDLFQFSAEFSVHHCFGFSFRATEEIPPLTLQSEGEKIDEGGKGFLRDA